MNRYSTWRFWHLLVLSRLCSPVPYLNFLSLLCLCQVLMRHTGPGKLFTLYTIRHFERVKIFVLILVFSILPSGTLISTCFAIHSWFPNSDKSCSCTHHSNVSDVSTAWSSQMYMKWMFGLIVCHTLNSIAKVYSKLKSWWGFEGAKSWLLNMFWTSFVSHQVVVLFPCFSNATKLISIKRRQYWLRGFKFFLEHPIKDLYTYSIRC